MRLKGESGIMRKKVIRVLGEFVSISNLVCFSSSTVSTKKLKAKMMKSKLCSKKKSNWRM